MSVWSNYPDTDATRLPQDLIKIEGAISERKVDFPLDTKSTPENQKYVDELNSCGVTIVKNVFSKEEINVLLAETKNLLATGRMVGEYVKPSGTKCENNEEKRRKTHRFFSVRHPLISCPSSVKIGINDTAIDIATGYLGCKPIIGGSNLRRSYVNDLKPGSTQMYHVDGNSAFFLKVFFYLGDVDMEGGPFTYIEGSAKKKFNGWKTKGRWKDKEIIKMYGKGAVRHLTAKTGDMIVANTTGFHKGLQPRSQDRFMFTLNYGVHVEGWKPASHRIAQKDFDLLTPYQRAAAEKLVRF